MSKGYFTNTASFYIADMFVSISKLSAFIIIFSPSREKQEDLEHCCDILRNDLKLIFTAQGN